MTSARPILGITMGDPAGVGPEIAAKALTHARVHQLCRPLVVGDAAVMRQAIEIARLSAEIHAISYVAQARFEVGIVDVFDLEMVDVERLELGKVSAVAGKAAFAAVEKAIELAMAKQIDGTVTGPIHKESINLAGYSFAGHTEIYAHFTNSRDVVMLLVDGELRIAHVSTHVPLAKVSTLVKKERVLRVIRLLADACERLGVTAPKIGVAGLNPHASDGGLFGDEEATEIRPAVEEARGLGVDAEGPVSPDTLFSKLKGGLYDGCVAMYHDQGHIPFKMETFTWNRESRSLDRIRGVNITLGLPIIRTSVDHGTAFDIAGRGIANPETLIDAIEYAAKMSLAR